MKTCLSLLTSIAASVALLSATPAAFAEVGSGAATGQQTETGLQRESETAPVVNRDTEPNHATFNANGEANPTNDSEMATADRDGLGAMGIGAFIIVAAVIVAYAVNQRRRRTGAV